MKIEQKGWVWVPSGEWNFVVTKDLFAALLSARVFRIRAAGFTAVEEC